MAGFSFSEFITLLLILCTVAIQITTKIKPYVVYMMALAALLLTGVLDAKQAFSGFSNSSVVTIGVLLIVCEGMVHTGVVKFIVDHLLGKPGNLTVALLKLMVPIATLSAFVMNTALTSMMVSGITSWSKRIRIPASKLLIPLSFAVCMGGMLTLLGKVSNLVIASNFELITGNDLSIFAPTLFAVICTFIGILVIILFQKLLPERQSAKESFDNTAEFVSEFTVPSDSPLIGQTLRESGIANISGTALLKVIKHFDMESTNDVDSENDFILGGDRMVFSGDIGNIIKHCSQFGLVPIEKDKMVYKLDDLRKHQTATAMVTIGSSLIGKTWKETHLHQEQDITLVAVSRRAHRIEGSPHDVIFAAGDTLLIEYSQPHRKIAEAIGSDLQFFDTEEIIKYSWRTVASVAIVLLMVVLTAFKILPSAKAVVLAAVLMLATECCSIERAYQSIKWQMLLLLSGAIVLGTAVSESGLASDAANLIVTLCNGSVIGSLIAMSLTSLLLANLIGSTSVASIFAPIAISAAVNLGCDPMPFCLVMMYSTTFCFATPTGCPPNVIVFFTGGYKYTDFLKIGLPVLVFTWPVAMLFLIMYYNLL